LYTPNAKGKIENLGKQTVKSQRLGGGKTMIVFIIE